MRGSGSTSRGAALLFSVAVQEWESFKLAGDILLLGVAVHKGDPVDLALGILFFGAAVHKPKKTINLGVNR